MEAADNRHLYATKPIISSVFTVLTTYLVIFLFDTSDFNNQLVGWAGLITLLIFGGLTGWKNILASVFAFAGAFTIASATFLVVVVTGIIAFTLDSVGASTSMIDFFDAFGGALVFILGIVFLEF